MKDLKRILLLVIAIVLSVSLCACDLFGGSDDETDDSTTSGEEVTTPGEGETTSGDKLGNEVPSSQVSGEHKPEESTDKKLTFVAAVQGEENDYVTLKTFVDTVVSAIASPDGSLTYEDTLSSTYWTVDGEEADANTPVKNGSVVCAHAKETVGPNPDDPNPDDPNPDDPNPDDPNPDDPNPDDPNPDDPNPDDPNPDDPNPDDPNPDDPNPDDPNPDDPKPDDPNPDDPNPDDPKPDDPNPDDPNPDDPNPDDPNPDDPNPDDPNPDDPNPDDPNPDDPNPDDPNPDDPNPDDPNPDDPNPDDPNPDDPNPDDPNPDLPDAPWAGELLIRMHVSNGQYIELPLPAEGPLTLAEFCQKYIGQSYEDTVNGAAWYFEGKEIDGDFVLTSNAPLDYVQTGAILPEFNENTVITKTAYEGGHTYCAAVQLEKAMTVRDFCLKFADNTFEELSEQGVWTLNGEEVVDGDAIVCGGDTLIFTYTSNGEGGGDVEDPDPEVPSMTITVIIEEDGKILQEMPLPLEMKEISLGEFCKLYMDGDFDTMTKLGEFFINGQPANADTMICDGDEVVFVLKAEEPDVPDPEEPEMTVTMITKYNGQIYENPPITISVSEITLKEFCEVHGEMDFAEMSAMGEWYVNGALADGKTLIHDGDEIVYLITNLPGDEPDEPEQPEMTVHVIFEYGEQVEKKPVTLTVEEITLGDFCKECFGTDYEQYVGLGEFYINGAPAGADAVLRDGDVLLFRVTVTEPNPDDPEEGLITIFVVTEVNGEKREEPQKLDVTEISVGDFCHEFFGASFWELIKKGASLYVNDVPADEKMMIRDGDVVAMIVKSDAPNPDEPLIKFVLYLQFANGTQERPFELYVESITLRDFCNEYSGGVSYEDMAAMGQWFINGEPADGDTLIYDGYEVRFVTKMDAPGSGEENPDIPDPTKGVTVWYNGQEYFVPQERITLYEFVNEYLGEDFDQGTWYVNGNVANEKTFLSGMCDLVLEIHGTEHMHKWEGGYCPECDTYCDHNMDWDDGRCCVICGMPMGVELWEIVIIENGNEVFYSQYGEPITLDDLFYSWYGRSWEDLNGEFVITVNGQECDGYYLIDSTCKVELNRRVAEEPEPNYYEVWVGRYYYYGSDDWNEMAWIDNLKTMWDSVPEGRSVYDTLAWMGVDFDESDVVYLNDTLVEDLYNTYITERSYLTVLDAEIKVEPIYITVKDQTGDLGSQHYSFAAPVSVQWLLNVVFDGADREAYDWHCSAIDYESVYIGEMIAVSATIDISYAKREVHVTDLESGKTETYYYEGAPMSVVEFAEEFLGITDFDAYYFYRDSGDSQPMEKDDLCDWRLVVLPKRMVPDKFVVKVEGQTEAGDTIKETLTLEMPENWNRIFDMAGLWIETDRYDIKINGVSVNTGKEQLTYLVYGDCTITLTPAYFLDVGVEPDGMYSVTVTDPDTTLAEIAEMLGIDGTKYVWEFNGNSGLSLSEKIGNYVYGYGRYYINLRPVRVGFYATVTDEFGNTSTYETWGEEAFPLQATAQQMVDWLNGHIWVSFDSHTIIWHNKLTGESIEITSPDFVWEYDPRMEGSIGTCYFAIEITCNLLRVNVEIVDPYSESGGVYDTLALTEAISIVEILEKYGYGTDRQMLIYDNGDYVDLDHVVKHSTHIRIEITAGTEEPDPDVPQEGFEIQYDVTDRDGVNYTGSVWVTETMSIADVLYSIENAPFYFDFGDGYEVLLNYELIDDSYGKGAHFTYVDGECTITVRPTYKLTLEGEFNETFYFSTEGPTPLFEIANRLGIDFNNYFWLRGGETVDGDRTVGELCDYDRYSYHTIRVEAKLMSIYVVYYDMYGETRQFPLRDAEDGISLEEVFGRVGLELSNQKYKISAVNVWGDGFEMELFNTLQAYHPGYELGGYGEGDAHYTVYVQSLSFEVKVTLFNNTGVNTYNEMILHEQISVGQVFDWVCDGLAFEELINFSFYSYNSDMWLDGADSMIWASCEITFQIPDVVIEGGEGEDSGEIDKGYITIQMTLYFENDNTQSNSFDIKGSYSTLENVYYNVMGEGALPFEESMKIGYWTVNGMKVDGSYVVYDGDVICFYQTVSMEGGDSGEDIPPVEEYPPEEDLPDAPMEGVTLKIRLTQYDINGNKQPATRTVISPTAYFIDVCPNLCGESFEFTQEWGYWMLDGKIVTADTVIYDGCHLELYQTKVPDDSGDFSEGESDSVGGGSSSDSGSDSVGGGSSSDNGASGDDGWGSIDDSFGGTEVLPPVEDTPNAPQEGVALTIHVTVYLIDEDGQSETFEVVSPSAYFIDVCPILCEQSFEFTQEWGYWMLDGEKVTPKTQIYDGCHLELYVTKVPDDSGDSSESGNVSSGDSSSENGSVGNDSWNDAEDSFGGTTVPPSGSFGDDYVIVYPGGSGSVIYPGDGAIVIRPGTDGTTGKLEFDVTVGDQSAEDTSASSDEKEASKNDDAMEDVIANVNGSYYAPVVDGFVTIG